MKAFITPAYVFTPGASGVGTIDLSAIPSFNIKKLVAVINQTQGKLVYSTASEELKFTAEAAGVVTLFADTSAMLNTDVLQVIYEDNTVESGTDGGTVPSRALAIAGKDGATFRMLNMTPTSEAKVSDSVTHSLLTPINANIGLIEADTDAIASTVGPSGSAVLTNGQAVMGWDGNNNRFLSVDTTGKLNTNNPAGAATAANQGLILAELQLKADLTETQPVSVASLPLPTGAATAVKQDNQATLTGSLTEAAPANDTDSSGLNGRLQRVAQNITTLNSDIGDLADAAVVSPIAPASVIGALKGVLTLIGLTNTKLDSLISDSTASFDSTSTSIVDTSIVTINPPLNAKLMIIQNSLESSSAVRFTGSSGTPSITEGYYLGTGQSTSTLPAGTVRIAKTSAVGGETGDVTIAWFV